MHRLCLIAMSLVVSQATIARAGLYYSGEEVAELPSQWRGFLVDQRILRNIAVKPRPGGLANPARDHYQLKADRLAKRLQQATAGQALTADELADLGALYIRLGEIDRALAVLRRAQREHPGYFRIISNLGTAWQLQGDLQQAATCLRQSIALAPASLRRAEEFQLRLVECRQRSGGASGLDDLFGLRYVDEDSKYRPGKLAATEREKLPADTVALLQRLALWLPADGKLLWQLAELAAVHGDVRMAAAIMDGCVTEFGMSDPELRRHRQLARAVADEVAASTSGQGAKSAHEAHAGLLRTKSRRPLLARPDQAALPKIAPDGVNWLPWFVLGDTSLGNGKPRFPRHLQALDGRQVMLTGFMQPLGDGSELSEFMFVEYPIGCWYCEMPEMTNIILVELAPGETTPYTRSQVKITGTLRLNANDPESFLYTISKAKVRQTD